MLNLSNRTAGAMRALQRMAAGMATAAPRIGDTKVPMSLLEKGAYINYQRIEDNLVIVRERCVLLLFEYRLCAHACLGCAAL
jgi:aconitate hydratase